MTNFSFPSTERLKSKKSISEIFTHGHTIKQYPLIIRYIVHKADASSQIQLMVSIPKRKIRSAVKRNLARRRIKEAYRLCKNEYFADIHLPQGEVLSIVILQISPKIIEFKKIQAAVERSIQQLIKRLKN